MPGNSFGSLFRLTTFGESHGECIGAVIDGCPPGLEIDLEFVQREMDRRRPGQSKISTQRQEVDTVRFVSGIFEGKTTGAPICGLIANSDQREKDYDHLKDIFRPSHADFTYAAKYGHRDHRGGGRASARETAARVLAGALAKLILKPAGIEIRSFVSQVGNICAPNLELISENCGLDIKRIDATPVRCPDPATAEKMMALISEVKSQGDTIGGVVTTVVRGCPVGLGEPVFDRLHADLGKAMLSINAAKAFEYGSGFGAAQMRGSEHNDLFAKKDDGQICTETNHSGGIQGGISNGMDIFFRVGFKPVATLLKTQRSVDLCGEDATVLGRGRHDPCVVPRAVPIVEAMTALVLVDHLLRARSLDLLSWSSASRNSCTTILS